ncbi:MAG: hypothetical protein JO000_21360 [Alphaproteobacteria bacterium]|nr:hypothetical protein [Alphaproteobacteria bacterium]
MNRVICYCDDCQAFAHELGRADLLDPYGGSDIIQVAPAALTFTQGRENIVGLRLSPKGLCRWHTRCCNTPVGNTVSPAIPFVGIEAHGFENPDATFDKPVGAIQARCAIGTPPNAAQRIAPSLLLRALAKVLGWKLSGKTWPHPFFARDTGAPLYPLTVVSLERRNALRKLCGPRPAAH